MKARAQSLPEPLPDDPMPLAAAWLDHAWQQKTQRNPNSMVLATGDAGGRPSARVMLCKEIVADPGYLVFYTNYESRKGRELAARPWAAAVFHWDALGRQLRVEGPIVKSPAGESDDYFASRPWQSRLAAITSQQSAPIASRQALLEKLRETAARHAAPDPFQATDDDEATGLRLPRPAGWGGYHLWAEAVELWVEGEYRLHDRIRWTRELRSSGSTCSQTRSWQHQRQQP
ncbi:MAG: pyridoxamine 5'-phosphate oxidase [Gammaproteobacteria bacterium]|nr:pyridoxamine 5'-phosphate oxidase [Gammaproteobacteria bacterium]